MRPLEAVKYRIFRSKIKFVTWQFGKIKLWSESFMSESLGCGAGLLTVASGRKGNLPLLISENAPEVSPQTRLPGKSEAIIFVWSLVDNLSCFSLPV